MARVIKAGGDGAKAPRRPVPRIGQPGRPVIEREVWHAQQEAAAIHAAAQEEQARIFAEGKRSAAQAREEAQAEGAEEAFAQAAQEALAAFRTRAERCAEAADDIAQLAFEVVRKILGSPPQLSSATRDGVLAGGVTRLRARRRLRVQVPASRLTVLPRERPRLWSVLADEPDFAIEAVEDVGLGFARVVTEVGGALCPEQTVLDQLASAMQVVEAPVAAPRPRTGVIRVDPGRAPVQEPSAQQTVRAHTAARTLPARATPDASTRPSARRPATVARAQATAPQSLTTHPQLAGIDPERTMQLDVRELQRELSVADDVEGDLDLFADDSILDG